MMSFARIAVLGCLGLLLTGCAGSKKDRPIWERVKITDLLPSESNEQPGIERLKTINFDVYVFEIPAEKIGSLTDVWQMLYTKPLRFNDYEAFKANLFLAGFGQDEMFDKVNDLLRAAGAKKAETVLLLLTDGQPNDLPIAKLSGEQTVFYVSTKGSMEGVTIGPGALVLWIKADKIPGSRGVCSVKAQPVFGSPIRIPLPDSAAYEKSNEMVFTTVGFELKMSPGDFFLLGPGKYVSNQITLSSLFFSKRNERRAVLRMFLFVCTNIDD